jgi:gamma-glutamyl:cysteine ligase YbdK (ATP-grasp superfamily)
VTDKAMKEVADRPANSLHEAFAKWIKRETGYDADVDVVTLALRLHPHFRTTDAYKAARAALQAERQAEEDAAHQRAQDRIAERARKLEEQAAALKAKLTAVPDPVKKGTEKAKQVAKAKPKAPAKPAAPSKPKAPARPKAKKDDDNVTPIRPTRARRGAQTPAVDEDDPF